jgi:PBSX family phage terminase large subunit
MATVTIDKRVGLLPHQWDAYEVNHSSPIDYCLFQGGFGSGKSYAGCAIGLSECLHYPGLSWLVTASSYKLIRDTTRKTWDLMVPMEIRASWTATPDILKLKNGSTVYFRHADPQAIRSTEFGGCHIEEGSLLEFEEYREVVARIRQKPLPGWPPGFVNRVLLTTNPQESPGWLDRVFTRRKDGAQEYRRIIAQTALNTYLPEHYIKSLESTMDDETRKIYLYGQTGQLGSGYVYHKFDASKQVTESVEYQPGYPLCLTMDFNVSFMYAAVCQIDNRNNTLNVIDEIALRRSSDTHQVCDEFIGRYGQHKGGVWIYGDPTGFSRDTRSQGSDYGVVVDRMGSMEGFSLMVSRKDSGKVAFKVKNRTMVVNKLLEEGRLLIHPRCEYLIRSLSETRWEQGKSEGWQKHKNLNPDSNDFVVDHPGDALDYLVHKQYGVESTTRVA